MTVSRELELALRHLRYGSIQMVVHDGHIVRIERIERIRLSATPEHIGGIQAGLPAAPGTESAVAAQAGLTDSSEAQRTSHGQPTLPAEVCQDVSS